LSILFAFFGYTWIIARLRQQSKGLRAILFAPFPFLCYDYFSLTKRLKTMTSTHAIAAATTEDFLSPTKFCQRHGFAHSTLSKRIRMGDIALHQFSGEARPKINVAEALQVMSAVRRPYSAPDLRLVRHDEDGNSFAPHEKADLFS
jgi:hypothetical protein